MIFNGIKSNYRIFQGNMIHHELMEFEYLWTNTTSVFELSLLTLKILNLLWINYYPIIKHIWEWSSAISCNLFLFESSKLGIFQKKITQIIILFWNKYSFYLFFSFWIWNKKEKVVERENFSFLVLLWCSGIIRSPPLDSSTTKMFKF